MTNLKYDFRASVVVFLVALPLGMGIAIASGYPPVAGIITGIVGGIVVGAISGAPLQVSGAAAGLTVITFQGVQQFGLAQMGVAILIAGLIQILGGIARCGKWFQAASPTVLHGMLAGIGLLILTGQFHVMADLAGKGNGLLNIKAMPETVLHAFSSSGGASGVALILGVLVICLMVAWPIVAKKLAGVLPSQLVAVGLAALAAGVLGLQVNYVSIPKDLFSQWTAFNFDFMGAITNIPLLSFALQIALIASAESMLCAAATDQMHNGERAKYNRELLAQGVGNSICGVLGVLPMTGVIVRSSANIHAGGKTRLSSMLHGLWLMVFVLLLPQVLMTIPTAALAGLLVFTGAKLLNPKVVVHLYRQSKGELFIFLVTAGTVVTVDLLFGVVLGLALSGIKLLHTLSTLHVNLEQGPTGEHITIDLRGAATFLRLPKLAGTLESLPKGTNITFRSEGLHLIDDACIEHLNAWRKRHQGHGGLVTEDGNAIFF